MLKYRLISALMLVGGLILAAYHLPPVVALLVLLAVAAVAQLEFYNMIHAGGLHSRSLVGTLCGAVLIISTYVTIGPAATAIARAYYWEQVVLVGSLAAVLLAQVMQRHDSRALASIGCTLLGIWYVPFLFNFITRIVFVWTGVDGVDRIAHTGRLMLFYLIIVVKMNDAGGYFVGRFLGRHRMAPTISPAKTWEGFVGGLLASVAASLVFFRVTGNAIGDVDVSVRHAVVLSLVLAVTGVMGDLFESMMKRSVGVKDSGSFIPGMGGLLDVVDSLLFGAPVLYVYVRVFLV
jgi:phosphatidate cytidylyltransferase